MRVAPNFQHKLNRIVIHEKDTNNCICSRCFRIDYLPERIREQGAASLSYPDKVAIWLFNFPMAIGGILIGAPEASARRFG